MDLKKGLAWDELESWMRSLAKHSGLGLAYCIATVFIILAFLISCVIWLLHCVIVRSCKWLQNRGLHFMVVIEPNGKISKYGPDTKRKLAGESAKQVDNSLRDPDANDIDETRNHYLIRNTKGWPEPYFTGTVIRAINGIARAHKQAVKSREGKELISAIGADLMDLTEGLKCSNATKTVFNLVCQLTEAETAELHSQRQDKRLSTIEEVLGEVVACLEAHRERDLDRYVMMEEKVDNFDDFREDVGNSLRDLSNTIGILYRVADSKAFWLEKARRWLEAQLADVDRSRELSRIKEIIDGYTTVDENGKQIIGLPRIDDEDNIVRKDGKICLVSKKGKKHDVKQHVIEAIAATGLRSEK